MKISITKEYNHYGNRLEFKIVSKQTNGNIGDARNTEPDTQNPKNSAINLSTLYSDHLLDIPSTKIPRDEHDSM